MKQLACFGLVGVSALIIHWLIVAALVPMHLAPLLANVAAFVAAFQVSYFGHRCLTFNATHLAKRQTLPRFLLVALAGFAANETLYAVLLHNTQLDYRLALLPVLGAVAGMTFLLSRQWAFR